MRFLYYYKVWNVSGMRSTRFAASPLAASSQLHHTEAALL